MTLFITVIYCASLLGIGRGYGFVSFSLGCISFALHIWGCFLLDVHNFIMQHISGEFNLLLRCSVLKSIATTIQIVIPASFLLIAIWDIIFCPFTFNLSKSLCLDVFFFTVYSWT